MKPRITFKRQLFGAYEYWVIGPGLCWCSCGFESLSAAMSDVQRNWKLIVG